MTLKQEKAAHELADLAKAGPKMILKKLNADAKAAGAPRSALDSTLRKGVPEKQQVRDHMKNRNRPRPQQSGGATSPSGGQPPASPGSPSMPIERVADLYNWAANIKLPSQMSSMDRDEMCTFRFKSTQKRSIG